MLSVGVVSTGGVGYYLKTVGSGVDDYYARSGPGRWIGAGSAGIGLAGVVDAAQIDALVWGANPLSGEPLGVRVGKVAAFDLTFSAPKSVSVLGELSEPDVRAQVAESHDRAVEATVAFLEQAGVLAGRRGAGGNLDVATVGAVAAGFVHRSSRGGDPQLHTHLLVFNRAQGSDGRWGGVNGRKLFAWAKTAGYVYQAALRGELSERLGVTWRPVENGVADLTGIADDALDGFSTRRNQIEAALADTGFSGARAAQIATLATRPAKPVPVEAETQREQWRRQAAELGVNADTLARVANADLAARVGRAAAVGEEPAVLAGRLTGPWGLTAHRSTFDRRDVIQAVAAAATAGLSPARVSADADVVLADPAVVATGTESRLAGAAYSTVELMRLEQIILDSAAKRDAAGAGVCSPLAIRHAIAARPSLSAEQASMVGRLCASGRGVEVVVGRAGTGKTFALDAARSAWEASGVTVIGAALAARTAAGLQAGSGIPSTSVDMLLADIARPETGPALPRRGVLVVDEAGMVGTRKLAALLQAAEKARTKVVLVGDPRQLPEVEAGGAFAVLARKDPIELTANRRQIHEWERAALDQLRHGDVAEAVTVYRDRQRITLAATAEDARGRLVSDWHATLGAPGVEDAKASVMIALHQADVDDLNARARQLLKTEGKLAGPHIEAAGKSFAVGDRVMALRNDRRVGITNGTVATVTAINVEQASLSVETLDGRPIDVPAGYLDDGHLTHGYAMTAHKSQGITVTRAFVLGSDRLYREAGYTALSRAVERSDLYQVAPTQVAWQPAVDAHQHLTRLLSRSAAQTLATQTTPDMNGNLDPAAIRDAALADPGQHLLDRLGPPPPQGRPRAMWAAAATAIDAYRARRHHNGPDPLGAAPAERDARREWEHAHAVSREVDRHRNLSVENDIHLGL